MASPLKKRILSFVYAFKGIRWIFSTQPNMWIHLTAAACATIAGFYFTITNMEWALVVGCIALVFFAEAVNTCIEWLVDSVYKERHPLAGKIKDVAAAGVLFVSIGAAITGFLIFFPYLEKIWA